MQTERRNRRLSDRLAVPLLAIACCMMIVASVLSVAALLQGDRIEENAKKLASQTQVQREVAIGARNAIRLACGANNGLRSVLRGILRSGFAQAKQYRKEGLFTQAQYERAIASQKAAIEQLKNTPCNEAADVVPSPKTENQTKG